MNFLDNVFVNHSSIKMSMNSYNILYQLYEKITNYKPNDKIITNNNKTYDEIVSKEVFRLIPIQIQTTINKNNYLSKYVSHTLLSGRQICIHIFHKINEKESFIMELCDKMYIWLSFLDKYANKKCSLTLKIYIFLTEKEKKLSEENSMIEPINANTAFTFSCKEDNEICIYRKEECFKVFIHETFHSFGLDFSVMSQILANKIISSKFKVISKVDKFKVPASHEHFKVLDEDIDFRIYESYCESWALVINIFFMLYTYDKIEAKPQNFELWKNRCEIYLTYENLWSIFQANKVMNHYGIRENLLSSNEITYEEQNTSSFSYYILKSYLINNIDEFILWSDTNNFNIIFFKSTKKNIEKFSNFIYESSHNLIDDILLQKCQSFILKNGKNKKWKKYVISLRMSLYG